jgi:hypothetical protein
MTRTRDDRKEKKQFWTKYFAEKLSVNGILLRDNRTARVRRLEDNRDFWRGVFDGTGTGRT